MEGDMNDIASALRWGGANSPAAAVMLAAAHLAAQDLPRIYNWECYDSVDGKPRLRCLLWDDDRAALEAYARYLGAEVQLEAPIADGKAKVFVRCRYLGADVEIYMRISVRPEPPAAAVPTPVAAPAAPDPAEAGQQPAAAGCGTCHGPITRPDANSRWMHVGADCGNLVIPGELIGIVPPASAEVLGQAPVTYPFGEDQDHAAPHQPPPTDPKSGMYGSIR